MGMTLFPTMSELWNQKELSRVGGREALTKVHEQMIILTDQMHQKNTDETDGSTRWRSFKNRAKQDRHFFMNKQGSCKAGTVTSL